MDGGEIHNLYPQEWAKLNKEVINEAKNDKLFEKLNYFINKQSIRAKYIPNSCETCLPSQLSTTTTTTKSSIEVDTVSEWIYFMRSGWLQSPKYVNSFWLGDQMVSWDHHDGIKSALIGMLSGSYSGSTLTHTDIGGYTMIEIGPYPYIRSKELLLRWIELATFSSVIFRTHIGSSMSDVHHQIYTDSETIEFFSKFTQIFSYLRYYRKNLIKEAKLYGYPVIRPMSFHYYNDIESWNQIKQYMFGSDFLIAPVLDPINKESNIPYYNYIKSKFISKNNKNNNNNLKLNLNVNFQNESRNSMKSSYYNEKVQSIAIYFPANTHWIHLWTGQEIITNNQSKQVLFDSPIGCPPIFYLKNSVIGNNLREFIIEKKWDAIIINELFLLNHSINKTIIIEKPLIKPFIIINNDLQTNTNINTELTHNNNHNNWDLNFIDSAVIAAAVSSVSAVVASTDSTESTIFGF